MTQPDPLHRPLAGQVILVTGATRGIGLASARALARAGAAIAVACRTLHHAEALAKVLSREFKVNTVPIELDVTNPPSVENMAEKVLKRFMRIDGIVNNAGVMHMDQLYDGNIADFTETLGTNIGGPYLVTRALIDEMIQCQRGTIVNIAAMAGMNGAPYLSAFCASKAALISLSQSWAEELAEYGIRSYALCPDIVDTESVRDLLNLSGVPLLTPEQVADRVVTLFTGDGPDSGSTISMSAATEDDLAIPPSQDGH